MIATLDQAIEDSKKGIIDFTHEGKCSRCGQCCCNYIPLSSGEIKEIKRYVKKYHIKEHINGAPMAPISWDLSCPFFSGHECIIYPVRPAICRNFQCDQQPEIIKRNKTMMLKKYSTYDMRETFFGEEL